MSYFKNANLQLERTKLSWGRTTLLTIILATVLLKLALFERQYTLFICSSCLYIAAYYSHCIAKTNELLIYDLANKSKKLKGIVTFIVCAAFFFIVHLFQA